MPAVACTRRSVIALGVALAVLAARDGRGAPAIDVKVAARSISPGELVVLTLAVDTEATSVRVRAFDRQMPAYRLQDGIWQSLVGVDLEQRPGTYTVAIDAGAAHREQPLVVQPRTFPTRRLRVDPEFVNPPVSLLKRIEDEAAFIRDVSDRSGPDRLWSAPFVRPVPAAANSRFGTRTVFNGEPRRPHGGADFPSAAGTPVRAPNAGRVVAARDMFFTGNTVIIDHGAGVVSLLAHLSSMSVREGQTVTDGQVVGRVGATGRVTGPHLHWGLTVARARVDPLSLLALVGSERSK